MKFPKERILIVRPCLKTICLGDKASSKLLSLALFYADKCEHDTFTFSSTQEEINRDLLDEVDVKTLHRTAFPLLRILGYMDVDTSTYRYTYTVHLDRVQKALALYKNKEQLDKCLIDFMKEQLDKCRTVPPTFPKQLVKCLIDMDKCLIVISQMSNCSRGRKAKLEAGSEGNPEPARILRSNRKDTFVGLASDGGGVSSEYEEHEEVSHSQWLSESIQDAEEHAPGGGTPVREPTLTQAPAPQSGRDTQHTTLSGATGQARTDRATEQPTKTSTHQPTETPTTVIPPPPITETDKTEKYKKKQAPLLTNTSDVRLLINAFRGFALEAKGPIINENIIIRELCELHPLEHFTAVMGHLKTCQCKKHRWWREGNQGGFKAENLRDLLPDILTELGMIPKPEEPPSLATPPPVRSRYTPWSPHEEVIPYAAVAR